MRVALFEKNIEVVFRLVATIENKKILKQGKAFHLNIVNVVQVDFVVKHLKVSEKVNFDLLMFYGNAINEEKEIFVDVENDTKVVIDIIVGDFSVETVNVVVTVSIEVKINEEEKKIVVNGIVLVQKNDLKIENDVVVVDPNGVNLKVLKMKNVLDIFVNLVYLIVDRPVF